MCGPQKVNTTSRQVGGGTLATTALPLSSFLLKNSQFQSNLVFVGQKARETGPMVQPCTRTIPASDPQRRGPKVPSTRGAAGSNVSATSTVTYMKPAPPVTRTRFAKLPGGPHGSSRTTVDILPRSSARCRRTQSLGTRGARLHDVLRHTPPPTRSKEVSRSFRVLRFHSLRWRGWQWHCAGACSWPALPR